MHYCNETYIPFQMYLLIGQKSFLDRVELQMRMFTSNYISRSATSVTKTSGKDTRWYYTP